jgi:type I restriction enzyme M protein
LEGLEISILKLSDATILNERFRFDSEFFKKEYLNIAQNIEKLNFKRLSEIDCLIKHPSEIKREYEDNGIWFFRTQNIRPLKIEFSNEVFISKLDAEKLSNNLIKYNDIVITRTGANFGQTAIFNLNRLAIGSSHTLILRNNYFNQSYLAVFLNTKYGRKLIN